MAVSSVHCTLTVAVVAVSTGCECTGLQRCILGSSVFCLTLDLELAQTGTRGLPTWKKPRLDHKYIVMVRSSHVLGQPRGGA
jgi:hypothetical protein